MTELPINQIIHGDCLEVMRQFPRESINFVMFSPPYWGLRDYGVDGQIGLEPDYHDYVKKMVEVGLEIKRVLRKDGSWYLNLGDSYYGGKGKSGYELPHEAEIRHAGGETLQHGYQVPGYMEARPLDLPQGNIPSKCQMFIPHRVALALVDSGWVCRNSIVWFKPNSMPSSVKDRLTNKYEFIFHLVKSQRYYYDLDAIRVPHETSAENIKKGGAKGRGQQGRWSSSNLGSPQQDGCGRVGFNPLGKNPGDVVSASKYIETEFEDNYVGTGRNPNIGLMKELGMVRSEKSTAVGINPEGKNPGDIISDVGDFWPVTTKPFSGAHFAVYPEALCERPIKAACPPDGIVLDPMCGSGTTCVVAKRLGRRFIGIDLNPDYCEMARKRLTNVEFRLEAFA